MTSVPPPYPPRQPMQAHQPPVYPRKKAPKWPWFLLAVPVLLFGGCTAVVASVGSSMDSTAPTTVKRVPAATVADFVAPTSTLPTPAVPE